MFCVLWEFWLFVNGNVYIIVSVWLWCNGNGVGLSGYVVVVVCWCFCCGVINCQFQFVNDWIFNLVIQE